MKDIYSENHINESVSNVKKNRVKNPRKWIIFLGLMLLALIGSAFVYLFSTYNQVDYIKIPQSNEDLGISDEKNEDGVNIFEKNKSVINILLFGLDQRDPEERGRSDSIMVLTIDPVNNAIKLSSLMRDSRVEIRDHGENKLGHAYAYGGPELAIHTVNRNFSLNIRHFASINYGGLMNVIDAVGGVHTTIREDEIEMVNKYIRDTAYVQGIKYTPLKESGYQLLDGIQAVGYSRIRKVGDGDYERTQRQRIVLSGIIRKLTDLNVVELPGVIRKLAKEVETNITPSYMLTVGSSIITAGIKDIRQARFPSDEYSHGETISGSWFLLFDKYATQDEIHNFIWEN